MTRRFHQKTRCPVCHTEHPMETGFNQWFRNHPDLDSIEAGIARFDNDLIIHRYKQFRYRLHPKREVQCLMVIEVKTHGAELTIAQRDTLSLYSQVLRNRKSNIHKKQFGRHAKNHSPLAWVYSHVRKCDVPLRMFGAHLLRLEDATPESSQWLEWDNTIIDIQQLVSLLKFDLDPDTLKPLDLRIHQRPRFRHPLIPGMDESA